MLRIYLSSRLRVKKSPTDVEHMLNSCFSNYSKRYFASLHKYICVCICKCDFICTIFDQECMKKRKRITRVEGMFCYGINISVFQVKYCNTEDFYLQTFVLNAIKGNACCIYNHDLAKYLRCKKGIKWWKYHITSFNTSVFSLDIF
jgi:hypothetical protein